MAERKIVSPQEALALLDEAMRNGQVNRANFFRRELGMEPINTDGAGFGDRVAVSAARGPGAGLATLQNRHPGADILPFGNDNFIIPGSQGPTVFNPPGLDTGDMSFMPRMGAEVLGSLTGGVMGLPGGIPGAMVGAGIGGELAGQMYDTGMQSFAGVEDTRGIFDRVGDTAKGIAFNSMGGPIAHAPAYGANAVIQNADRLRFDRAMAEAGIPALTPGQLGSRVGQRAEGWLESTLTGGPALDRQRAGVEDSFRGYIDEIYPTELSRDVAGQRATMGVESTVADKRQVGRELYDHLDSLIESVDGGRISIPESRRLLAEFENRMLNDPEYASLLNTDPDLSRYINTLRAALDEVPVGEPRVGVDGDLTQPMATGAESRGNSPYPLYDTIKQFRTDIGRKLESPFATATDGGVEREKRRLYGVLSDDLAAGADELGGVGAVRARTRADTYWRTMSERLEKIDPVFKHADNPTAVYEGLGRMVRNNPGGLAAAKKTMPIDAWNDFSDTYIQGLLTARPGAQNAAGDAVSYHTIANNLNRLRDESPEAWRLLAGDKMNALENILTLANKFRESERFFNRSRTANTLNAGGIVTAASSGASVGVLTGGGATGALAGATIAASANTLIPWLTAKVLTSPNIRSAVARMPTMLMGGDVTPQVLARSLVAAGASEEEVQELLSM